jgi:hypothetical protein
MFDKAFGLRVGQILARDEYMLVERHVISTSFKAHFIGGGMSLSLPHHERLRGSNRSAKGSRSLRWIAPRGKARRTEGRRSKISPRRRPKLA